MLKGLYKFKNKEGVVTKRCPNFITDKGYDFWTGSDPTLGLEVILSLELGTSLEGIVELAPEKTLTEMQSNTVVSLLTSQPTDFKIILNKSPNSAVLTHRITAPLVDAAIVYELGLKLGSGELVSNALLLSNEKTDIIPILVSESTLDYEINIVLPTLVKEYEVPLSNNGNEIIYKVKLELLDTVPADSFSLRNPIKIDAKILEKDGANVDLNSKPVRLSSFNKLTKEAVYNLVFPYSPAIINKPASYDQVTIESSLGCYRITLYDMTSGSPVNNGFPETNAQDLVIPFKLTL